MFTGEFINIVILYQNIVFISVDLKDDIVLPNPHISDPQYPPSLNSGQQSVTSTMMTERQTVITDGREAYQISNNGTWRYCKHIITSVELYTLESDKAEYKRVFDIFISFCFPERNWLVVVMKLC